LLIHRHTQVHPQIWGVIVIYFPNIIFVVLRFYLLLPKLYIIYWVIRNIYEIMVLWFSRHCSSSSRNIMPNKWLCRSPYHPIWGWSGGNHTWNVILRSEHVLDTKNGIDLDHFPEFYPTLGSLLKPDKHPPEFVHLMNTPWGERFFVALPDNKTYNPPF